MPTSIEHLARRPIREKNPCVKRACGLFCVTRLCVLVLRAACSVLLYSDTFCELSDFFRAPVLLQPNYWTIFRSIFVLFGNIFCSCTCMIAQVSAATHLKKAHEATRKVRSRPSDVLPSRLFLSARPARCPSARKMRSTTFAPSCTPLASCSEAAICAQSSWPQGAHIHYITFGFTDPACPCGRLTSVAFKHSASNLAHPGDFVARSRTALPVVARATQTSPHPRRRGRSARSLRTARGLA